jgi:hypothetical protein
MGEIMHDRNQFSRTLRAPARADYLFPDGNISARFALIFKAPKSLVFERLA